jgi:hypothetical protein
MKTLLQTSSLDSAFVRPETGTYTLEAEDGAAEVSGVICSTYTKAGHLHPEEGPLDFSNLTSCLSI